MRDDRPALHCTALHCTLLFTYLFGCFFPSHHISLSCVVFSPRILGNVTSTVGHNGDVGPVWRPLKGPWKVGGTHLDDHQSVHPIIF